MMRSRRLICAPRHRHALALRATIQSMPKPTPQSARVNVPSRPRASKVRTVGLGTTVAFLLAAIAVIGMRTPAHGVGISLPFVRSASLRAVPSLNAFGASREVKLRLALPGETVEFPIEVSGDPSALSYTWVELNDTASAFEARPIGGAQFDVPPRAGFYHLALLRGAERHVL